jgi:hypothetical protein
MAGTEVSDMADNHSLSLALWHVCGNISVEPSYQSLEIGIPGGYCRYGTMFGTW